MARPKRKRKERAERLHREPIVREVARIIDVGVPTKWRWTSAAHHGVRSALCMKGLSWADADKRAGEIVTLARHRVGISLYPNWAEAQGSPPEEREYNFCAACGGRPEGGSHSRPWCSEICRNVLYKRDRTSAGRHEDVARERAKLAILTGGRPSDVHWQKAERRCHHCSHLYTPTLKRQRFCSHTCGANAARGPARDCLVCAQPFVPKSAGQRYCRHRCERVAGQRRARQMRAATAQQHALICRICETLFTSTRSYRTFCSDTCVAEGERRRRRAQEQTLICKACEQPFTSTRGYMKYCGNACKAEHERRRSLERYYRARERKRAAEIAEAA